MQITGAGVVFAGQLDTGRQSCAFPHVCVLPNGRWLAACRAAPTKADMIGQHVLVSHSDDAGATWSSPTAPFSPPPVDGRPGLFRGAYLTALGGLDVLAALMWTDHSDPTLPFFNAETEGLLDMCIFHALSRDGGRTWEAPQRMDTTPFDQPTPLTGPTLLLPDGQMACQFELNKHYYDPEPWRHAAVQMYSDDSGATFPRHSIAARDPADRIFYWDQRASVMPDGSILAAFWTYDTHQSTYLDIHLRRSPDEGRTWSPIWSAGFGGQPAAPVALPDGGLFMAYVDRSGAPAIRARVSRDGGLTWPQTTQITLHAPGDTAAGTNRANTQDAWSEMEKFAVGLPASALAPGGDVVTVYYAGSRADHTDVRWALTHG